MSKVPKTRKTAKKTTKPKKKRQPKNGPVKLNIGGGDPKSDTYVERKGYVLIDRSVGKEAFPLDYPDESVDEVYASHILEHFPYEKTQEVVREWARVLKPGGLLKVSVPNFAFFAKNYGKKVAMNLNSLIMGGHRNEDDQHRSVLDADTIRELMANAGLQRIGQWEPEIRDCSAITYEGELISCNYLAYKPSGPVSALENVSAVLATPRFGPVMHFKCILDSFTKLRLPCNIIQGCYWWMQLCQCIEEALADGAKYILTLDYDSIFTIEDVLELYHLLQVYPEADVVCALQSKRGGDETVLIGMSEEDRLAANSATFDRNLTKVVTGHFGCTMFRADKLRSQPRPWMMPKPASDGTWRRDSDAVHPDIQFWHDWAAEDKTLYVANRVVIGHMEEKITWPSQDFTPIYQSLGDYMKDGRPVGTKH